MFKIEKDIPVEITTSGKKGFSKYPFSKMEVGDSVVVPKEFKASARMSSLDVGRKLGMTFTSKTNKDDGSVRIWRIA